MNEYAKAGVDYRKLEPFKEAMVRAGRQTLSFPNDRGVFVAEDLTHAHGAVFEYRGRYPHAWCKTQEGLGNLNWIAEWMYLHTGISHYDVIARAAALIIANDVIAQGALPVIWTDEVAAGDSDWFADGQRSADYARGCVEVCRQLKMAMPAGESPALKYLVNTVPPVKSCPTLSGSITGIIAPKSRLVRQQVSAGDVILGSPSTGLHANGISLLIKRALELPQVFLTLLPDGRTLGEHALIPMASYAGLVEALLNSGVKIHALLPGTGSGIAKLAFDKQPLTYRVYADSWPAVPPLFQFMRSLGVSIEDCLTTFNWGIGFYVFVRPYEADWAIEVAGEADEKLSVLGVVEEGARQVIFEPEGVTLPPPGE